MELSDSSIMMFAAAGAALFPALQRKAAHVGDELLSQMGRSLIL